MAKGDDQPASGAGMADVALGNRGNMCGMLANRIHIIVTTGAAAIQVVVVQGKGFPATAWGVACLAGVATINVGQSLALGLAVVVTADAARASNGAVIELGRNPGAD